MDARETMLIRARLEAHGLSCTDVQLGRLAAYLNLLAKWNRTINLTALAVNPVSEQAIDRLIVEPVAASAQVLPTEQAIVDLGSGGGSPALPLQVMLLGLKGLKGLSGLSGAAGATVTLVESRSRKCAFLREAARALELPALVVESRFEDLDRHLPSQCADAVTLRAVRLDEPTVLLIKRLLKPCGRVLRFVSAGESADAPGLTLSSQLPLVAGSELQILQFAN